MPDESLMVTFKQVTGPTQGRKEKDYNYSGLDLANVYLRSTDGGATWGKTAEDKFRGPSERPAWGGSHCALKDGSIIRAVDGSQMPSNDLPRRIFFQRSSDLGKTWGAPEIPPEPGRPIENYIGDFADCITRVRRLSDGRLLATGVARDDPDPKKRLSGIGFVMFSKDDGKTWVAHRFKRTTPEMHAYDAWDEWDWAELPNNQFLGVFRRRDPHDTSNKQVRWQGIIHQEGKDWIVSPYQRAPFPHSGHPDLLVTKEGIILHIATTGVDWTDDAGAAWHPLHFEKLKEPYKSRYYPRTVQMNDGRIIVISHVGSDNYYGSKIDQSITMDTFRLVKAQP